MQPQRILVFGATGAIGQSVIEASLARGWQVTAVARTLPTATSPQTTPLAIDPLANSFSGDELSGGAPYNSVCWAQGANLNDSIYNEIGRAHV